jgi:hypothetical protein
MSKDADRTNLLQACLFHANRPHLYVPLLAHRSRLRLDGQLTLKR